MASAGRDRMATEVERTLRTIFRRCVQCPGTAPSCPSCKDDEICSLVPQSCNTCAHSVCIANPNPSPHSARPNIGAIAGGVIGGVAVVAILVFLVWRFWIKKRREQQELEADEWEDDDDIAQQKGTVHQFNAMRSDAASTRTRGSLANSILSRASNIIQIAYIPGVTNRNGSGHTSLTATTPVPPIPAQLRGGTQPSPRSPLSNEGDALFFRPGDLRDSTYSASSSFRSGNRDTQYTRQSITPSLARSSMASDIYRDNATEVPMPAQTVKRAAPRVVSVKTSHSGSPEEPAGSNTPVSAAEHAEFAANTPSAKGKGIQVMMPGHSDNTSASGLQRSPSYGRAKQITVGGSKGRFPVRQTSDAASVTRAPAAPSPLVEVETADGADRPEHTPARHSLIDDDDTAPAGAPSPFFDASERLPSSSPPRPNPYASMARTVGSSSPEERSRRGTRGIGALSDIIEEATRRASREPSHEGLGGKGAAAANPFDDVHSSN